jgi:hypothetical protein
MALSIGANISYFGKAINGEIVLSDKYINSLQNNFKINPEWYRYGTGNMILTDDDILNSVQKVGQRTIKTPATDLSVLIGEMNERLIRIESHLEVYESAIAEMQSEKKGDFMKKVGALREAVKAVSDRRFSELHTK